MLSYPLHTNTAAGEKHKKKLFKKMLTCQRTVNFSLTNKKGRSFTWHPRYYIQNEVSVAFYVGNINKKILKIKYAFSFFPLHYSASSRVEGRHFDISASVVLAWMK